MNKTEIIDLLEAKHERLFQWLENHDDQKWILGPEGKWCTGEHVVHLIQTLKPLNKVMLLPRFVLAYRFGKSNRETRDYDTVVNKYLTKLAENPGVVFAGSRNMPKLNISDKPPIINELRRQEQMLIKRIKRWSEHNLDKYILPHPGVSQFFAKMVKLA